MPAPSLLDQLNESLPTKEEALRRPDVDPSLPDIESLQGSEEGDDDAADDMSELDEGNAEVEGGEADEGEADEGEDEEGEEASTDDSVIVKIAGDDGEEEEISLADLKQSHINARELAKAHKQLKDDYDQVGLKVNSVLQNQAQEYQKALGNFEQWLMAVAAPEFEGVDMLKLAQEDPAQHVRMQARIQQINQALQTLQSERTKVETHAAAEAQKARAAAVEASRNYLKKEIKGWSNDLYHNLLKTAVDVYGFKPEEAGSVIDPRVLKMMHDAYTLQQLRSKTKITEKKVTKVKTPTVKPGVAKTASDKDAGARGALQRFKRTRSDKDAADFFLKKGFAN